LRFHEEMHDEYCKEKRSKSKNAWNTKLVQVSA
jgi:hypothetical protein